MKPIHIAERSRVPNLRLYEQLTAEQLVGLDNYLRKDSSLRPWMWSPPLKGFPVGWLVCARKRQNIPTWKEGTYEEEEDVYLCWIENPHDDLGGSWVLIDDPLDAFSNYRRPILGFDHCFNEVLEGSTLDTIVMPGDYLHEL